MKLKNSFKIVAFAAILFSIAGCNLAHNQAVIALNLGGQSRAISDEDKQAARFDIYFNDELAGEKVAGAFSASVTAGTLVTVRLEAFANGRHIATGETVVNVVTGTNYITVIMKEIEADGPQTEQPPAMEETVDEPQSNYVAEIVGGQGYEDVKDAFKAVTDGQTLRLLNDVEITSQVSVQNDMTLDLNGFTLSGSSGMTTRLITVSKDKKLTLQDSKGGGKLTGGNTETSNGGAIYLNSGSSLLMSGGEISGNAASKGGAVYVSGGGTFEMTGGTITNNTASASSGYSGGVYVSSTATVKLSGKINITGNTANGKDDDLYTDATLSITGPITGQIGISAESMATASPHTVTNGWAAYKDSSSGSFFINNNDDGVSLDLNNNNEYEITY